MATTSILYLDVDDEITSAAARIRDSEARRVAIVLPYGSRVATSRINFRLLARDALTHEKRLSIVAADAATRALAASAGLPVFSSVNEYEDSEEGSGSAGASSAGGAGAEPSTGSSKATGLGASAVAAAGASAASGAAMLAGTPGPVARQEVDTSAVTVERPAPAGPGLGATAAGAGAAAGAGTTRPVVRPERVSRPTVPSVPRTPLLVALGVIALVVVVGAVAAYLLLPSATIAITPRQETIGPTSFQVVADPSVSEPDLEAGVVPATVIEVPLEASDTFAATGKRVEEQRATGTVRFENLDFTATNSIAKGAVVSTESGIRFRTDKAITIPRAELVGLTVVPSAATVTVTAVDAGPEGNVAQNSITSEPRGENPLFLNVTNPEPTSGGSREEFPRVTQEDVDAAVADLQGALTDAFDTQLADPDLGGGDVSVFPDTAALGDTTWSTDLEALVGQEIESFDLGGGATGTVMAVDETPIGTIAETRLGAAVEPGYELVPDSSDIQVDEGTAEDGVIRFPVTVTASQVRVFDPAEVEALILGMTPDDAAAVLEEYGTADIVLWPDWVSSIPTMDGRVQVVIVDEDGASASPSPSEDPP